MFTRSSQMSTLDFLSASSPYIRNMKRTALHVIKHTKVYQRSGVHAGHLHSSVNKGLIWSVVLSKHLDTQVAVINKETGNICTT